MKDTWVDKTNSTTSYGSDTTLKVRPSAGVDQRALVQFDLSSIPPGSIVLNAMLYLTVTNGSNYAVQFYPVTQPWSEIVTWDTQPTFDAISAGNLSLAVTSCTRVSVFSTALVSSWINNPATNYGIYLYPPSGSGQAIFSSREGANPPTLVITYIPSSCPNLCPLWLFETPSISLKNICDLFSGEGYKHRIAALPYEPGIRAIGRGHMPTQAPDFASISRFSNLSFSP